ncbi:MAG: TetR/AcrR family transcriptional regulator [Pseudomonadota bacterium]
MDLITEQKHERRTRILETARRMIVETGYQSVTVRELARQCGVSVPTLYNQFGGKDGVLSAAVESYFREIFSAPEKLATEPGYKRIMSIVERWADELVALSGHHRSLVDALTSVQPNAPVQETLAFKLSAAIQSELETMKAKHQIAEWIGPEALAMQITSACISASVIWSRGFVGDNQLTASMKLTAGLFLLGLVESSIKEAVEHDVKAAQSMLD